MSQTPIEMPLEEALELADKHAAWFSKEEPLVPSVSRTLAKTVRQLERDLADCQAKLAQAETERDSERELHTSQMAAILSVAPTGAAVVDYAATKTIVIPTEAQLSTPPGQVPAGETTEPLNYSYEEAMKYAREMGLPTEFPFAPAAPMLPPEPPRLTGQEICDNNLYAIRWLSADYIELLRSAAEALQAELVAAQESNNMRLAAISTATIQNTHESAKERIAMDHPYSSVAYQDVCVAIDREISLRTVAGLLTKDAVRYRAKREAAFQSHTVEQVAVRNVPLERAEFYQGYDYDVDAIAQQEGRG